ncbi:hypothetical protein [Tahibacter soli]|uniref:Uncharacterized protein n=1 Tax=Tahibacter soli TaxID=2983605 RepID=A0A9X3YPE0_9GAMM|nr:hypothetical protein [Tahibacter soli]MDC8016026.1 hypothetical protein [Tahibacter soli]
MHLFEPRPPERYAADLDDAERLALRERDAAVEAHAICGPSAATAPRGSCSSCGLRLGRRERPVAWRFDRRRSRS